jgi:hypothetical protein
MRRIRANYPEISITPQDTLSTPVGGSEDERSGATQREPGAKSRPF